ncbi:MAG: hypothetical protein KF893_24990 [Caldilineaceae bacterium]|nr:hypothetical protein [Caldilineaceae bacterium]
MRGRLRQAETPTEIWLAVEVSMVIDENDVRRANRRAALLRKAGFAAVATVAGEQATAGAMRSANETPVLVVQNGSHEFWEDALIVALQA